jgi:hypothetical protein
MKTHARLMIFSLTACIVYSLAYYFDWSLFRYYLGTGTVELSAPDAAGPPILWYGWLATAVLAGTAAAFLVPRQAIARLSPELAWLVPSIALLAALMYELRWFL